MRFTRDGIPFVSASGYSALIRRHPRCVMLIISPEEAQMRLVPILASLAGDIDCFVIPITGADSHLVEAVRVPRLRVFNDGRIVENIQFSKANTTNFVRVLKSLKLV